MRKNTSGFSLMELMAAVALVSILALIVAKTFTSTLNYVNTTRTVQSLHTDGDNAVNTIIRALNEARGSTIVLCACQKIACNGYPCSQSTPGTTAGNIFVPPNSRIEYTDIQGNADSIYWVPRKIYMQNGTHAPVLLANNVTGLMFTGDMQDPTHLSVTVRLDALGSSTQNRSTVIIANQVVRLAK